MVIKLVIKDEKLIAIDEATKMETDLGEVGGIKIRKNPMEGKPRWKDGSLLTIQEAVDEIYQKRMRLS